MHGKFGNLINGLSVNQPAPEEIINEIEEKLGFKFPCDYVDFMRITNGGEGKIGENSYLAIWQIENLIQYNEGYAVAEFAPGLLIFGSDGGDMAYAFDTRDKDMPIVDVPFIGMDIEEIIFRGNTFIEFLEYLSK